MGRHRIRIAAALLALGLASPCGHAAKIVPVGIVGNGGEAGESLFLFRGPAGLRAGCAIDDSSTAWLSGGDSILRVALDGRVIGRFPLEPAGSLVDGTTFALIAETLYFIARDPRGEYSLYSLDTANGAAAQRVTNFPRVGRLTRDNLRIAAQARGGKLLVAYQAPGEQEIGVAQFDPQAGRLDALGRIPGERPESIVFDAANGTIFVGGRVFVDRSKFVSGVAIARLDEKLEIARTVPPIGLVATPTAFIGRLSLAGTALWDASESFGFIARFDEDFARAPGVVMRWEHGIDQAMQVAAIDDQAFAISTDLPGASYVASWLDGRLAMASRLGSLPDLTSLAMSADGWIGVGDSGRELWWRWEDASNAPPRLSDLSIATSSGFFRPKGFFAFGEVQQRNSTGVTVPLVFSTSPSARNAAARPTSGAPVASIRNPCCVALLDAKGFRWPALVLDAADGALYRMELDPSSFVPVAGSVVPVSIVGARFTEPTSLVALADHRLLVADRGRILTLAPDGNAYKLEATWDGAGASGAGFGNRIYIAGEGDTVLVADTQKHRVLWVDPAKRSIRAQFGATGIEGKDLAHLSRPTFIAIAGGRALVADTGNQRVVKLGLGP